MSKITRPERVLQDVVVSIKCDNCGKTAPGKSPDGWHHFSRSHGDWGNDSIDSYEDFDVCSGDCWLDIIRREVEDYNVQYGNPTLDVDGMDYEFLRSLLDACRGPVA